VLAHLDVERADAARSFDADSRAGELRTLTATSGGLLIVAAVAAPTSAHAQDTATDVVLFIERVTARVPRARRAPADPLADAVIDENVPPGQTFADEVKRGQYIQVMDVQGRECSDFQAFSRRALDTGLERDIDPATTRSLVGSLYPAPGLFSKYFSDDMEPLVEIVQDTCGRHDTFGLACTARHYEDLGYPGHVNCSDNINRELDAYGVRPRAGWPAINFFFNTLLDDGNAILMDDPWSRPGDFVLLRASSDLRGTPWSVPAGSRCSPSGVAGRCATSSSAVDR